MSECMPIPDNWKDFVKEYSFKDIREVYTNGSWLIPTFRVEQMMEHYYHEWISVKDRLPKPFKQVLVYDAFEENITVGLYGNGDWLFSEHITHWMPLPEPPIK